MGIEYIDLTQMFGWLLAIFCVVVAIGCVCWLAGEYVPGRNEDNEF